MAAEAGYNAPVASGVRERRRFPRTASLLKVDYRSSSELLSDYLHDLSEGGLFVRTDLDLQVGQRLRFAVSFPGLLDAVELEGVVRWRTSRQGEGGVRGKGVGCEFLFRTAEQKRWIAQLVARLSKASAPSGAGLAVERYVVLLVGAVEEGHERFLRSLEGDHEAPLGAAIELTAARSAIDALHLLDSVRFDLGVIDYALPGLNGADLIRHLRGDRRASRMAIVATGPLDAEARRACMQAGADLYLEKPIAVEGLVETLSGLLHTSK